MRGEIGVSSREGEIGSSVVELVETLSSLTLLASTEMLEVLAVGKSTYYDSLSSSALLLLPRRNLAERLTAYQPLGTKPLPASPTDLK